MAVSLFLLTMTKAVSRSKRVLVSIHINLEDRENEHKTDSIFLAAILAYLARHYGKHTSICGIEG